MKINPHAPAFAQGLACSPEGRFQSTNDFISEDSHKVDAGLTIRAYFAGLAMQGMLANNTGCITYELTTSDAVNYAKDAVLLSDILITELNKEQ